MFSKYCVTQSLNLRHGCRAMASRIRKLFLALGLIFLASGNPIASRVAQNADPADRLYKQLHAFTLGGGSAPVTNLVLKRDRVEMTFTGTFYFTEPADGHVTGAVFVGQGTVHAEPPPSDFERDNLHRLVGADALDSDFR